VKVKIWRIRISSCIGWENWTIIYKKNRYRRFFSNMFTRELLDIRSTNLNFLPPLNLSRVNRWKICYSLNHAI
jgi:hypothetical protein